MNTWYHISVINQVLNRFYWNIQIFLLDLYYHHFKWCNVLVWFDLFDSISTFYELFNAGIWVICKWLIVIITILFCLIINVLATETKFLEPSDYCTLINCAFIFSTKNVFGCFHSFMIQFKHVKYKPLN